MMKMRNPASTVLLIVGFAAGAYAAAPPELIPMWDASDESNTATIDHGAWQELLDAHLQEHPSGVNRFDYAGVKANAEHRKKLSSYLLGLTGLDPRTYSRNEQKAYWINLYNALTVFVIVGRYPVESIRDIKSGLLTPGPWEMELITIQEQKLTLDNIEHGILRPIWKDPRIHYAVNCASIGCPNLSPEAFRSDNLERLLDQGARDYVNHPRGMRLDGDDPRRVQHLRLVQGGLRRHRRGCHRPSSPIRHAGERRDASRPRRLRRLLRLGAERAGFVVAEQTRTETEDEEKPDHIA